MSKAMEKALMTLGFVIGVYSSEIAAYATYLLTRKAVRELTPESFQRSFIEERRRHMKDDDDH